MTQAHRRRDGKAPSMALDGAMAIMIATEPQCGLGDRHEARTPLLAFSVSAVCMPATASGESPSESAGQSRARRCHSTMIACAADQRVLACDQENDGSSAPRQHLRSYLRRAVIRQVVTLCSASSGGRHRYGTVGICPPHNLRVPIRFSRAAHMRWRTQTYSCLPYDVVAVQEPGQPGVIRYCAFDITTFRDDNEMTMCDPGPDPGGKPSCLHKNRDEHLHLELTCVDLFVKQITLILPR